MTQSEIDYASQVAELLQSARKTFNKGAKQSPESPATLATQDAVLTATMANAVASLAVAHEARIQNLLAIATAVPADGSSVNPEIIREAYTTAAVLLGLVDVDDDAEDLDLADGDPADADLGDLK